MKTVLIAHNYNKSTFANMSYQLAHHLANKGLRVIFISHKPFFEEIIKLKVGKGAIIVFSWPTKKRPVSIKDFLWFSKIYLKYKPKIVLGHFVGSNISILASKLLSFGKVKTYIYYHALSKQLSIDNSNTVNRKAFLFNRKKVFYKLFCDKIICPSELAKEDLNTHFNLHNGVVIPNPMEDRFIETNKRFDKNSIIISYLGRLDGSKGIIDLVEAFKSYISENKKTKLVLKIAGSGAKEESLKDKIKDSHNIEFYGSLAYKDVDDYINKSHFMIIPSKYDNLPTVGLESLMNACSLINI